MSSNVRVGVGLQEISPTDTIRLTGPGMLTQTVEKYLLEVMTDLDNIYLSDVTQIRSGVEPRGETGEAAGDPLIILPYFAFNPVPNSVARTKLLHLADVSSAALAHRQSLRDQYVVQRTIESSKQVSTNEGYGEGGVDQLFTIAVHWWQCSWLQN